jgi:hypothetical protein
VSDDDLRLFGLDGQPTDDVKRAAARRARDEAMSRVAAHTDPEWKDRAQATVIGLALRQDRFTADDVWEAGLPKPREARALGPVLMNAAKKGWICSETDFTTSTQANCHGMPRRVWRSLVRGTPRLFDHAN